MTEEQDSTGHGRRVGWVELYFDLVFVFAVSQVTHAIVADPRWAHVASALGLFATLWWTWIGFALLYNRVGDDTRVTDRLFVLAGTVPCAIAATQAHHAFDGHPAGFAGALAGVRLILAVAHWWSGRGKPGVRRITWGYAAATVVFTISAFVPRPWVFVLWAFALIQEAGFLLLDKGEDWRRERHDAHRPSRAAKMRSMLTPSSNPGRAVDAGHLSERFGLFMILLLGELVITVGGAALDHPDDDLAYWLALCGGLVLAGALWWVYFTSAAEIYERMLDLSGGNPALAYFLYAGGHLFPAFSLLLIAAGVDLSLHESPPASAAWFVTAGLTAYLSGTRVFSMQPRKWYVNVLQIAALAATVNLALLSRVLSAPAVVAVIAVWAVGSAALSARVRNGVLESLSDNPAAFFRASELDLERDQGA
ncbi:low temperature requirement protein A [Amycolatopsis sp. NPDC088138]|uniref:low temperature requirement protein A n=1 Tax=Amycolatopsis sp. NPDC088138 TaxID=3363938 RepID=UPI00381C51F7